MLSRILHTFPALIKRYRTFLISEPRPSVVTPFYDVAALEHCAMLLSYRHRRHYF